MDLLFTFPGYEELSRRIRQELKIPEGKVTIRRFPDSETFIQLHTDIRNKEIAILCSLDQPDQKAVSLLFFTKVAKELGAKGVGLIAPYLGYLRQDKRFHEGEAITSQTFAHFLSFQFDWLLTIDPHLHRYKTLEEIYSIPCIVLHTADLIAQWIEREIHQPLLIGPDRESHQWVSEVASMIEAPFIVLKKIRHGDKDVAIANTHQYDQYMHHTPVVLDDIISSARTMITTVAQLKNTGMGPPVCIGIHPIFAEDAYDLLNHSGASRIVTCNTIPHPSNMIDVSPLLTHALKDFL